MLYNNHGIAKIAQPPQRVEQALVIALMQANRRLIQHIKNPGKTGTYLRSEPNALAFAAGQSAGIAR